MKTLSFVIPVYNEEERLEKTFNALSKGFSYDGIKLEKVLFVNDGSTDNTALLIKKNKQKLEKALKAQVKVITYSPNKGKGYAVRTGLIASDSDYTLFFDADMSTPITEFSKFMPIIKEGYDVIVGTRKNGHSTVVKRQPLYREVLGRGFTLLSQVILNTWVTDFTCGFKLFSKKSKIAITERAKIDRWGYDAELMFLAQKLGFSMKEKSVLWANDERTKVNLLKALPQTLSELFMIRLNDLAWTVKDIGASSVQLIHKISLSAQ